MNVRACTLAIFLISLIVFPGLASVEQDYEKIDIHARQAPEKLQYDVKKLTAYLVKPARNDYEKVRSFYVWIADNIAYDVQLFRHYNPSRYQQILPDDVLKRKKAVCQGYADLFQEMCRLANISSYVVGGYSKGFGYTQKKVFTTADHAWNVVRLENQWHLVDVTWGSGGLNDKMRFVKEFSDDYFLTDPKVFVINHLPLEPMWQLLECPVPVTAYAKGDAAVQQHLTKSPQQCLDYAALIASYESKPAVERELFAAEQAYAFNPENPVVLARGYMNIANQLMNSIPRQLSSREAIVEATATQEEAVTYLKEAEQLLNKVKDGSADPEKQLIKANLKTSEQNLKGLKNALK